MQKSKTVSQLIKRVALLCLITFAFVVNVKAQISVSGGTGLSATYSSFTKSGGLFAALNSTPQTNNTIVVSITADITNEDGANALNAGVWTSITITPSGARTISGAITGTLISLNGADSVIINGLNTDGNSLIIANTTVAAANTVGFTNDASNNIITNCTVQGSSNSTTTAVINFGSGTTTGNDANTISNNNITAYSTNLPVNIIYSNGTSASVDNSDNIISGNNISDFFSAGSATNGILLTATGNNTWTISNNKFFQTATRTYTTANTHSGIQILGGDGYTILGNTIGYANSSGTGTYTLAGTVATRFVGINLTVGTTTTTTVQSNTIAAINLSSANTTGTGFASLCGISVLGGNVIIGASGAGNTIGSTSGTGSLATVQTGSGGGTVGINSGSTGTVVIQYNSIGGIQTTSATASNALVAFGIVSSAAATSLTINNNTIGNATSNNILGGTSGTTTATVSVAGISLTTMPASVNINTNTIQNLVSYTSSTTAASAYVKGIVTSISGVTATSVVYNNTIKNLTTTSGVLAMGSGYTSAAGIHYGSGNRVDIYGNTIFNISNTNAGTTNTVVVGISLATANNFYVYQNKIYGFSHSGTGTTATAPPIIAGIAVRSTGSGYTYMYNNMISFGNSLSTNTCIIGIWQQRGNTTDPGDYVYHNTVNIEGTVTSGALSTFCFNRGDLSTTARVTPIDLRNNIFTNTRSGGTGRHFAIANNFGSTGTIVTGWSTNASNYNILNAASATVGYWAADKTFAAWKTSSASDANSLSGVTVTYANSANDLHINMGTTTNSIESQGTTITGYLTDFDGDARPGPVGSINGAGFAPDLGADEFDGVAAVTCTTPIVNTVVANPASISCYGATTSLSLGTPPSGVGYLYQWQSSTDNTNFTNIAGATLAVHTATPTAANNYYRCIVTCVTGPVSTTSNSTLVTAPTPLASGTYTIDSNSVTSGTNYQSFAAAISDLTCKGVAGPVTFNVTSTNKTYTSQVTIPSINGASATNTITFNGNGQTLNFNSTTTGERAGFKFDGAKYVTVNNFIITGTGTYAYGVQMLNNADNNTVSNCTINIDQTSTSSTNYAGVVINSIATAITTTGASLCDSNTITGNTIIGGYAGVAIVGNTSTSMVYNNKVTNNTIRDFYLYGVYQNGGNGTVIQGNDFHRPNRSTVSNFDGVYLTAISYNTNISKNKFHNPFGNAASSTSAAFCIYLTSCNATSGNENIISNNIVYDIIGGTGNHNGFLNNISSNFKYYHNTTYLNDASATCTACNARGLYFQGTTQTGVDVRNNSIVITQGGDAAKQCIFFEATSVSSYTIDNNNYFISTTGAGQNELGRIGNTGGTGATTIPDWQTATGKETNSVSLNPVFSSPGTGNLKPTSTSFDNLGTNVSITTDILNVSRSNSTPDIGAYEFSPPPCTAPPTSGTATSTATGTICYAGSVTLDLSGNTTGVGQTYQWYSSSTVNGTYSTIGSSSTISQITLNPTASAYYKCEVTCSGNSSFSTTVLVSVGPAFSGTFTINSNVATGGTNYQTFTEAINALSCGIAGPVVFNVAAGSGPYNEQITIPAVSGTSATNTITINGNNRTLSFNSTTASARVGITLNGADYVTIDNLKIDGSAGTYGWGVLLTNSANYNTISNCNIKVSETNITTTNHYCIVISGSNTTNASSGINGSYNTFTGNTLTGGYYVASLYGSSTAALYNTNNTFSNNIVTNSYGYSIYGIYQKNLTITGNDISRPTRTTSGTAAGLFLGAGGGNLNFSNNRIHNMFDGLAATNTATLYGVYLAPDGTAGNENKVTNNLIYFTSKLGTGSVYGIYNSGSSYAQSYHNTIVISDATSTAGLAYGLYQTTAVSGIEFKNNLVSIARGGTGTHRGAYFATATTNINCNNNNYHISGNGTDNAIGTYVSTSYTTLTDWKTANSNAYDQNSGAYNPVFVDATNDDYTPNSGQMDNIGTNVGVSLDILGNTRSNTNPDVGAIEFTGAGCQDPPTPGNATSTLAAVCTGVNFTLDVTGASSGAGQTYQWQISTDNSSWSDIGTASVTASYTLSQTSSNYYRVGLTCSGGAIVYSNSIFVNTPSLPTGTYTINKNQPASSTNFQSFAGALSFLNCGIGGPVVFNVASGSGPYNEQITINPVIGASATNTVTFNGNGNTLSFNSITSTARTGITLNGADHIVINNLVIDGSAGTYCWGVLFINAADSNVVSNCTINASTTNTTSGNHIPVIFNGSASSTSTSGNNANYNTVTGCTLNGGYYGIFIYGNSSSASVYNVGNSIVNNVIKNTYIYSTYCYYQKNFSFVGNDISRPNRATISTGYGIYFPTGGSACLIEKNKVHNMFDSATTSTSTCYGVYVGADGESYATNPTIVRNNLVYNTGGNGTTYGIYAPGDFMKVYHNTIVLNDTNATTATTYGIYQTGAASCDIRNNLVHISRTGIGTKECLHYNTTTATIISNYNNLVMTSTMGSANNIGYYNSTSYSTLTSWKTANSSAFDQNSYSILPAYNDAANGNYQPITNGLNNLGTPLGVTNDIVDSVRNLTTPDIGAFEFDIMGCANPPTPGTVLVASTVACIGSSFTLDVTGNSYGAGQVYQWQISSNNNIFTNIGTADTITQYTTSQSVDHYYRLAITCNGGTTVYTPSMLITSPAYVNGTFTIDATQPTGGNNFSSFTEAADYISCGINGPVVFDVAPNSGPYNEQVVLPPITGTSATNTITFNGNGNTLLVNSTNSAIRGGFTLYGTDYVTIDNMVVSDTGNGSTSRYAFAFLLTNLANHNTISNCIIDLPLNTTSSNYAGIALTGSLTSATGTGNSGSNNTFTNNTINGGYYGITCIGSSTYTAVGNQVINNSLVDQYFYHTYNSYQNALLIKNNDITTSARTTYSTQYGVMITTGVTNSTLEKNKVHGLYGASGASSNTSTAYGIYLAGDATAGNENKVYNNLVYDIKNNGSNYGIYNTGSPYMKIYHNTIVLDYSGATTGATYGVYQTTAATGIDIRNNNVYVTRGGTGIKRCLAFVTNTSTITSNNNNLYLNAASGTDNNLGAWGTTTYATLTNWKTANGNTFDQNSVSINPSFADVANGNYAALATGLNGVGATTLGVTTDIVGNNRTIFFTPGAYEVDNQSPTFSNTAITNACAASVGANSVSLNGVNIIDGSGIVTNGVNMPRIYFRKGTSGSWSSTAGIFASGTATNSLWNFTINYSGFGSAVNVGDVIQYFVVAQDVSSFSNVGANVSGLVATNVNSITTYPPTPSSFTAQALTPSVSISTASTTICSGNTTLFAATGVNSGSSPIYQWKKNGNNVATGTSIGFPANTLSTGDVVTCVLTANNTCQTVASVVSNSITMIVNQSPVAATILSEYSPSTTTLTMCNIGNAVTLYPSIPNGVWSSSNVTTAKVVRASASSYSAIVTALANGSTNVTYTLQTPNTTCSTVSTIATVVAQQATPNAITGVSNICVGNSTTFTTAATGGVFSALGRFNVNAANGFATATSAGTTTIRYTITNASGCSAYSSLNVTVNPLPAVPSIAYASSTTGIIGSGGYCKNKTFTVAGTPTGGNWASTGTFSITSGGVITTAATTGPATVTYSYTNSNGCTNSRTIATNVVSCGSKGIMANEDKINNTIQLYPNPAHSLVNLKIDKLIGTGSIIITDLYGKQVKQQTLSLGINIIDVSNLAKGMYLVSIVTDQGKQTQKIVVE
ncbi:unnamed protein product [Rotaria sp. Silwood1]|nr:unnamed protein product [Rotaria sp. Silwood1]CAF4673206.1 unnamed protein product [Rotaria sp. Silwood1]